MLNSDCSDTGVVADNSVLLILDTSVFGNVDVPSLSLVIEAISLEPTGLLIGCVLSASFSESVVMFSEVTGLLDEFVAVSVEPSKGMTCSSSFTSYVLSTRPFGNEMYSGSGSLSSSAITCINCCVTSFPGA